MNYYNRNLGDYARDTPHLSMAAHGAYTRLTDYYYATEKPIPANKCDGIANAMRPDEIGIVRAVLNEFFYLTAEGWRHKKCDEVIAEYHAKSLKAKQSANARWSDANALRPQKKRNANQEPITKILKARSKALAHASRLPDDWQPSLDLLQWAGKERPDIGLKLETDCFRDYWHSQGRNGTKTDWDKTYKNWIRRAKGPNHANGNGQRESLSERVKRINREAGYPD